jgi:hypothetical protein
VKYWSCCGTTPAFGPWVIFSINECRLWTLHTGVLCDLDGYDIPPGAAPPHTHDKDPADNYSPFNSHSEFEFSEFLCGEEEMSASKIDKLLNILAALYPDENPPVADHKELYLIIDEIKEGNVMWNLFSVQYNGEIPKDQSRVPGIEQTYEVWFQNPLHVMENQLGNPDFKNKIDYAPKRIYKLGKWQWTDLMSGNWSWMQAVCFWFLLFASILTSTVSG